MRPWLSKRQKTLQHLHNTTAGIEVSEDQVCLDDYCHKFGFVMECWKEVSDGTFRRCAMLPARLGTVATKSAHGKGRIFAIIPVTVPSHPLILGQRRKGGFLSDAATFQMWACGRACGHVDVDW